VAYTWSAFICLFLASRGIPPLIPALKIFIAMTFVSYGVYLYNDLMDLEDDLKGRDFGIIVPAERPLGSGRVSKREMAVFSLISFIIGLSAAYTINLKVFTLQLLYAILGFLYSTEPIKLKKRYLMKQLTIATGNVLAHLSGGLTLGSLNSAILYVTGVNFLIFFGVDPIVDLRDIEGDKVIGVKSFPVIWGPQLTVRLAIAVFIISGIATLVGYSRVGFNIAMPILFTLIVSAFIYVLYPLLKRWNDPSYLDFLIHKRLAPLYLLLQITPLIGILPLSL
jgi:4-hydroxybenzoate polyprenyltransferase